ncbi:hypothetical protein N658DRAFT_496578 [Parathielavia hyrcaniae]|uniref:Uncharacterized protein n=1 Tax=Parathielavia hyrcaniae TaxID=113614 RepID=A0AAN6Q0D7_9PEZI|nr:hypothetical protein N658DRAFT_496578 [Parathielavia hyrcaniae]
MGRQVLCDLLFHLQGVATPRSYCAACRRPKTSISRIRSEVSERPEIPHHPARQPRFTDTNDEKQAATNSARSGGYWLRKPPDFFDVLKKRQGTPGPAQFWESEVKSLGGKTDR